MVAVGTRSAMGRWCPGLPTLAAQHRSIARLAPSRGDSGLDPITVPHVLDNPDAKLLSDRAPRGRLGRRQVLRCLVGAASVGLLASCTSAPNAATSTSAP